MAFTTSGQETEWALFLQPRSPHGAPSQIAQHILQAAEIVRNICTTKHCNVIYRIKYNQE